MPRYYFDSRDNDSFLLDDEGFEHPCFEAAKRTAARALVELARDVLPGSVVRTLAIEVRDDARPLFKASLQFEVEQVREPT